MLLAWISSFVAVDYAFGVDALCCGFFVDYDGEEDSKISDANRRILDYYVNRNFKEVVFNPKEKSLVSFFLQLSRYLQQSIGTVAAIDFNAYANSLGIKIDQKI